MGADLVWIQHERPDGHRSLWFLSFVGWVTLTDAKHNMTRADVGRGWFYMDDGAEMIRGLGDYQCPTPTPEDLAWLRGAT